MSTTSVTAAPALERVRVTAWEDPIIDRLGHDPRSAYVERYWLGILGPSTVWLLRRCANELDASPDGFDLDLLEVAGSLGLGHKGGRNSPLARTIARACRFGSARAVGTDALEVRRRIPPLNQGQVNRLPTPVQRSHQDFLDAELNLDEQGQRQRARRLALGLVECGDGVDDAELQLGRWRFHPSIAAEAVRWAWEHHHGPLTGTAERT